MKTKEEILGPLREAWTFSDDTTEVVDEQTALPAMDEYAKQQAMAFAEWKCSEGWESYDGTDRWICVSQGRRVVDIEELYQMFIESQNKGQ